MSLTIRLPRIVYLPRKRVKDKRILINYNTIHNIHRHTYNDIKIQYRDLIKENINLFEKNKELFDKASYQSGYGLHLHYTYYSASTGTSDLMNQCIEVDKFFCDALSENGIITDDNVTIVPDASFNRGGYWKNMMFIRCDISIKPLPHTIPDKSPKKIKLIIGSPVWFVRNLNIYTGNVISIEDDTIQVEVTDTKEVFHLHSNQVNYDYKRAGG